MVAHDVLIMYATQTGNARGIAKDIGERAETKGHKARVVGMENFKDIDFESEHVIVVVASCTGNGDCPDNGDKFFRYCKRKTTPPFLSHAHYTVCSLGDSNYDAFCAVGKDFDKNFDKLGGKRLLKRVDVDEVEGIETFVEPWLEKLWDALAVLPPKGAVQETPSTAETTKAAEAAKAAPPAEATGDAAASAAAAVAAVDIDDDAVGASASRPLRAPVLAARWLTSSRPGGGTIGTEAGERRVLHVEIDVSSAPAGVMAFEPGDALGVCPRNPPAEVDALLAALAPVKAAAAAPLPTMPGGAALPGHLAGCESLGEAFAARVDIGSISVWPPLPLLRLLVTSAAPSAEADLLARAKCAVSTPASPASKEAHASLQRERPSLCELVTRLGSTPDLAALLDVLPPLAPRFYSISNSPAAAAKSGTGAHGGKLVVELCLSIVQYYATAPDGSRIEREGLCSNMIGAACAPLLGQPLPTRYNGGTAYTGGVNPGSGVGASAAAAGAAVTLDVFKREAGGYELRLPPSPSTPIMLIGPGTGLAPFRSFLQHRRYTHERSKLGPCHVFFGCRREDEDFLYKDELTALAGGGAIKLHTAFSRQHEESTSGYWRGARIGIHYVQDRICEHAAVLCDLLFEREGRVYVCGDGQAMAKDVHEALRTAVMRGLKVERAEADAELEKLSREGRYCREIWN
jgi:sulfite reductase alpha subunit-like flavoprotein